MSRLPFRVAAGLALLALPGCAPPPGAVFEPSAAARSAPEPQLTETARFSGALAEAAPDAERLSAQADALAARAAALRERAGGLSSPVLEPQARQRLADPERSGALEQDD